MGQTFLSAEAHLRHRREILRYTLNDMPADSQARASRCHPEEAWVQRPGITAVSQETRSSCRGVSQADEGSTAALLHPRAFYTCQCLRGSTSASCVDGVKWQGKVTERYVQDHTGEILVNRRVNIYIHLPILGQVSHGRIDTTYQIELFLSAPTLQLLLPRNRYVNVGCLFKV